MSRSCESAMPIAFRYSSFERKCVSSERCNSASAGWRAGVWTPDSGMGTLPSLLRAVT